MKKLLVLTIACLLLTFTSKVSANEDNNDPSPSPQVVVTSDIKTNLSGTINNSNTNTNSNSQKQSQKMKNNQEVNITNSQPIVLGARTPKVLPATGVSPLAFVMLLAAIPLGLYLRRYGAKSR